MIEAASPERLRLRQICLVAPQLEPAVEEMGVVLGLKVCHRDPNVAVFGLENALFVAGTTFLEIVAPKRDGTAAGRFLQRSGGRGGYIVIFDCADPSVRKTHAEAIGVPAAYEINRPGDYHFVQLHPRFCRAAMLEFDRTEGGEALTGAYGPAGGNGWQAFVDKSVTLGVRSIEALSPDPLGLARHWSSILQRPVREGAIHLDNASINFAASAHGEERLDSVLLDAASPRRILEAARARGCATARGEVFLSGMRFKVG